MISFGGFLQSASFEHSFWLQILGDHAGLIRDSLFPDEADALHHARKCADTFNQLSEQAPLITPSNAITFTKAAADQLKEFKLTLIRRQLEGNIDTHLTPSFLNHMVNELEEYELLIGYLKQGEAPPVFHELHHHMRWLLDASGHASTIHHQMDQVDKQLKKKSERFPRQFEQFYLKAIDLTGLLRTNIQAFPALERFNHDVAAEMGLFQSFLCELEEMGLLETALSNFSASMVDHTARETCYYLMKLAESANTAVPNCHSLR